MFSSETGATARVALSPISRDVATTDHKSLFKGYTVTTLDRNHCSPEEDAKLVALINGAYKSERVTLAHKAIPTAHYFCLSDGVNLLACAGYARGDQAGTGAREGLTGSDCFIAPFAAVTDGQGYGKKLLQCIEKEAKSQGFKTLTCHVWNDATVNMHPYYRKIGFKEGDTIRYIYEGQPTSITRYHWSLYN